MNDQVPTQLVHMPTEIEGGVCLGDIKGYSIEFEGGRNT